VRSQNCARRVQSFNAELYDLALHVPSAVHTNSIDANDYTAELLYAVFLALCEQPQV
jgi:hypothetical protein